MKNNFLANVYIKRGDKKIPMCIKHAKRETGFEQAETIPSGSEIGCVECSSDFLNN